MKIFTKIFFILILTSPVVKAQDPHFSQFYYSPFTLNPAITGNIDGTYRLGLNYRNQWASISPMGVYSTASAWADIVAFRGKFSGNTLGMGLLILDDKQGDGHLATTNIFYSVAYHQSLDPSGNYHLSAGLQGGLMQRRIDPTKLYFYNQFNGAGFDENISSGEKFQSNYWNADFGAGAAFSGLLSNFSRVTIGFAAFHLTKPNESFKGGAAEMYVRYTAHAEGTVGIKNKVYLFPAATFQAQVPNSELVGGSAFGYNFSPNKRKVGTIFYVGGFYRVTGNDAIIATAGFILKGFQLGISYDINSSGLKTASGGNGGPEIAIKYGNFVQQKKMKKAYCPRF